MGSAVDLPAPPRSAGPFALDDEASYRRWRDARLAICPRSVDELGVDIADPLALTAAERGALLARLARANMAIYRGPRRPIGQDGVRRLGLQLGLRQLDANWLADEDGVSRITVTRSPPTALRAGPPEGERPAWGGPAPGPHDGRGGFIPYTDRPIRWHTDGYYHPRQRRIRGMILHCVQPAAEGGVNALLDHEIAYILLRDASPDHVRALMAPDAMTIPERRDDDGVARPAQTGPVFSVDPHDGTLHMRYTARTRSVEWKADAATRAAVACLEALLTGGAPQILHLHLQAGWGIVAHNVLHERSGFRDDPDRPRLLYRARYLDRTAAPSPPWR